MNRGWIKKGERRSPETEFKKGKNPKVSQRMKEFYRNGGKAGFQGTFTSHIICINEKCSIYRIMIAWDCWQNRQSSRREIDVGKVKKVADMIGDWESGKLGINNLELAKAIIEELNK